MPDRKEDRPEYRTASRVERERGIPKLSAQDQMMLAESFLAPPAPPARLVEAARRYKSRAAKD